ncbi:MAG: DUF305 domain-containing protein [Jatrophihabitans sp.]
MLPRLLVVLVCLATVLSGCGDDAPAPDRADRTFLQEMIPHHERAIETAKLGVTQATDPRVHAFAERIVREQTPELDAMRHTSAGLHLDFGAGTHRAQHRISDGQLAGLRRLRGVAFDRQFLRLHIYSEQGAASMARVEIDGGADTGTLKLARNMATAPTTQIPELHALLLVLGG